MYILSRVSLIYFLFMFTIGCHKVEVSNHSVYNIDGQLIETIDEADITNGSYKKYLIIRDTFIRTSNNATSEVLIKISEGDFIYARIVKNDDGWHKIYSSDGDTGYIFGEPLKLSE